MASQAWAAASHLHWGLWGLAQSRSSSIDFDYLNYAQQRLRQFESMAVDLCRSGQ